MGIGSCLVVIWCDREFIVCTEILQVPVKFFVRYRTSPLIMNQDSQ
jgi:hypothetical protein